MPDESRDRLRRLRLLQRLAQANGAPVGEMALLIHAQRDPELQPTIELVRQSLRYLAGYGLVSLIEATGTDWLAGRITSDGAAWLSGSIHTPDLSGLEVYAPEEKPPPAGSSKASSISKLPAETKAWVDQELSRGIHGYQQLVGLLSERGYEISKSAMGRYGKRFREEQRELRQSIEMAKAFAETVGDDQGAMAQTLTALAQQEMMAMLRDKKFSTDDVTLPALVRAISDSSRSDVGLKRYQSKVKADLAAATARAEVKAKAEGMTADTWDKIKLEFMGIA